MEQGDGHQLQGSKGNTISPPILHRVSTYRSKRQNQVLKIGGIWILYFPISLNHFNIFFIPRVEDFFCSGDWIMRVENSILRSYLIARELTKTTISKYNGKWIP
jgi:hypothetical protein